MKKLYFFLVTFLTTLHLTFVQAQEEDALFETDQISEQELGEQTENIEQESVTEKKVDINFRGSIEASSQNFIDSPLYSGQESSYLNLTAKPQVNVLFGKDRNHRIVADIHANAASVDRRRNYIDFRKLYYEYKKDNISFLVGNNQESRGFFEIADPSNIINTQDFIASPIGGEFLGTPMAKFSFETEKSGTFDFIYHPFSIPMNYSGYGGRFRSIIPISNIQLYEESQGIDSSKWDSFSVGYNGSFGNIDLQARYFDGIARNPFLKVHMPNLMIVPYYPNQKQLSFSAQIAHENMLFKASSAINSLDHKHYNSGFKKSDQDPTLYSFGPVVNEIEEDSNEFIQLSLGMERNFLSIFGSNIDLTLLAEYIFNENTYNPLTILNNDLALGTRISINDKSNTVLNLGALIDLEGEGTIYTASLDHDIFKSYTLSFELYLLSELKPIGIFDTSADSNFDLNTENLGEYVSPETIEFLEKVGNGIFEENLNIETGEFLFPLRRESYIGVSLTRYF